MKGSLGLTAACMLWLGLLLLSQSTAHAAPALVPCQFVTAYDAPATVPRGTPEMVTVAAFCPGSATITFSVLVNGSAYNLTLAETVPGPVAVATFAVPTSVLPPGTYTVLVFANWTPSMVPVAPFTVTAGTALAYAAADASVVYECVIGAPYYAPPLVYYVTEPALLPESTLALWRLYGISCELED